MTLPTPYAPEPAAAQSVSLADLFAARLAEAEAESAARHARMAASLIRARALCDLALRLEEPEPVAAEPAAAAAAEPVAAEPAAAEPAAAPRGWLQRLAARLRFARNPHIDYPIIVARYRGTAAGWQPVGSRTSYADAARLRGALQRIHPAATVRLSV